MIACTHALASVIAHAEAPVLRRFHHQHLTAVSCEQSRGELARWTMATREGTVYTITVRRSHGLRVRFAGGQVRVDVVGAVA